MYTDKNINNVQIKLLILLIKYCDEIFLNLFITV